MKSIVTILIILLVTMAGYSGYMYGTSSDSFGSQSEMDTVDFLGTELVPISYVASNESTTTVALYIGADVDTVDLNIHAITASSTPGHETTWQLFQTSDTGTDGCASTTDLTLQWVDIVPITSTPKTVSTSTYSWLPNSTSGVKHQITNWNGLCLKMELGSASTTMWVSANLKGQR